MSATSRGSRIRILAGGLFLSAQLVHVVYVHLVPARGSEGWAASVVGGCSAQPEGCRRYFAWAPNDYLVEYRIQLAIDRPPLGDDEVEQRYRIPASGTLEAPVQHLIDALEAYDREHPSAGGHASVTYRVNRGPVRLWPPAR